MEKTNDDEKIKSELLEIMPNNLTFEEIYELCRNIKKVLIKNKDSKCI